MYFNSLVTGFVLSQASLYKNIYDPDLVPSLYGFYGVEVSTASRSAGPNRDIWTFFFQSLACFPSLCTEILSDASPRSIVTTKNNLILQKTLLLVLILFLLHNQCITLHACYASTCISWILPIERSASDGRQVGENAQIRHVFRPRLDVQVPWEHTTWTLTLHFPQMFTAAFFLFCCFYKRMMKGEMEEGFISLVET